MYLHALFLILSQLWLLRQIVVPMQLGKFGQDDEGHWQANHIAATRMDLS